VAGPHAIGIDLGGTKILAGIVDASGAVEEMLERPTPTGSQEELIDAVVAVAEELKSPRVVSVGCGVPVRVDTRTGLALAAVNLPLANVPLEQILRRRLELPTTVVNDGSAAALGEFVLGAGRGASDLALLTLGTGVGGGLVLGGRLYRGWSEVGHMVIVEGGVPCQGSCTGHGHVESYCSGTAADPSGARRDRASPRRCDRLAPEPLRPRRRRDRRRLRRLGGGAAARSRPRDHRCGGAHPGRRACAAGGRRARCPRRPDRRRPGRARKPVAAARRHPLRPRATTAAGGYRLLYSGGMAGAPIPGMRLLPLTLEAR
jgi:hypothetical protein